MTKVFLSSEEFKESIRHNIYYMGLDSVFNIERSYIDRLYESWLACRFKEDYRAYVSMLLTLPENITFVDTDLLIFKIARRMGQALIVQLAEAFYYDENESIMGEELVTYPYQQTFKIGNEDVKYFLDIVDTIYERFETGHSTVDILRDTFRDDHYLN